MNLADDFDVPALERAYREIKELELAAIARVRLWLEMEGNSLFESFHNDNGFEVKVNTHSLLSEDSKEVIFFHRDAQGRGDYQRVSVPIEVIFGDMSAEFKEFAEYKRLQEKFGKK